MSDNDPFDCDDAAKMIDDLLRYDGDDLTAWEVEFVDSVDKQRRAGRSVSDKQRAILKRLIDKI